MNKSTNKIRIKFLPHIKRSQYQDQQQIDPQGQIMSCRQSYQFQQLTPFQNQEQSDQLKEEQKNNNIVEPLLSGIKQLMKNMTKQKREDLQPRDRYYLVDVPKGNSYKQKKSSINRWLEKVVSNSVSIAFNYYLKDQMTYEQAKVYCSSNILKNIAVLTDKYQLTGEQFKQIDCYLRDSIIPLLEKKYPLTETINVNKELESLAKAPDQSKLIYNDFLFQNKIVFNLRKNENYDDLIKGVINLIIQTTNNTSVKQPTMKNYEYFEKTMKEIFELVQSKEKLLFISNDTKKIGSAILQSFILSTDEYLPKVQKIEDNDQIKAEKIQYRQKVKQYTHYLIGRKLPAHISPYSKNQLDSRVFDMKNPAILRILTKWCQQLEEKFKPKNYFLNKRGELPLNNGQLKSLSQQMYSNLDNLMQKQKIKIRQFMEKLVKETYQTQLDLLKQLLDKRYDQFWEQQLQTVSGKFSVLIGMSLQKWILKYLNRLIHGLLTVADTFHKGYASKQFPCAPNLLTFSIGDLMRCKCSSQQREIIRIFEQLKEISSNNPELLKILRVKNRLNLGTNDILINFRFGNMMTCEMQLAINQKKSKFIVASNKMSHFLYQLQRSMFGPINQLCSIQRTFDQRCLFYTKEASAQLGDDPGEVHHCQVKGITFNFESVNSPFICSICTKTYSQNVFVLDHVKCSQCSYWKCASCVVRTLNITDLSTKLINNPDLRIYCQSLYEHKKQTDQIPQYGMAIDWLKRDELTPLIFKKFVIDGTTYLINQTQSQLRSILTTDRQQKLRQFEKSHIIIKISKPHFLNIDEKGFKIKYILKNKLKQDQFQSRKDVTLNSQHLNNQNLQSLFDSKQHQMKMVTKLIIKNTQLNDVSPFSNHFPHLQQLQLINYKTDLHQTQRQVCNFKQLLQLKINHYRYDTWRKLEFKEPSTLQKLCLEDGNLESTVSITDLPKLRQLIFSGIEYSDNLYLYNKKQPLSFIFSNVSNLQKLEISFFYSSINLSEIFSNLLNLKVLDLRFNTIEFIPQQFTKLQKLQELYLEGNPIRKFPKSVANLKKLHRFEMVFDLQQYPSDLQEITNLAVFKAKFYQYRKLVLSLKKCNNLQTVDLQINHEINKIPEIGKCEKLKYLNIKTYKEKVILIIPNSFFQNCCNLETLLLISMKFDTIPKEVSLLKNLVSLTLNDNQLTELNSEIAQCFFLKNLTITKNLLKQINFPFESFKQLQSIDLSQNQIVSFDSITLCTQLRKLSLHNNQIQQIPKSIKNLQYLQELDLSNNNIWYLPQELQGLLSIKEQSLYIYANPIYCINFNPFNKKHFMSKYNQIFQLPQKKKIVFKKPNIYQFKRVLLTSIEIKQMRYLTSIIAVQQSWSDLPEQLSQLSDLFQLNVSENEFEHIPNVITRCISLKNLNLSSNKIKKIPIEITQLTALTYLDLSSNQITQIPIEVGKMTALTRLYLSSNQITQIPIEIGKMTALKELYLSSNQITQIPIEIGQLTALNHLYLNQNPISKINDEIFSAMKELTHISLSSNNLTHFPHRLFECVKLQQIYVKYNQLASIEGPFENLKQLRILDCNKNRLTQIPLNITNCENLIELHFGSNQLTDINIAYQKLVNIQKLSFQRNKIKEIPNNLTNLKKIKYFDFNNNEIQEISNQIKSYIYQHYEEFDTNGNDIKWKYFRRHRKVSQSSASSISQVSHY